MTLDDSRPETGWRRASRRIRQAAFITVAACSIRVTLEAVTRHRLRDVSAFLRVGGKLNLQHAEYEGAVLLLRPGAWFCLGYLAQLLKHGAKVRKTDGRVEISLPGGRIFELATETLLPSSLVVLHERFVEEEYGELQVAGAVVIDVGAHIGDSAVYFADNGAVHVYAYEPFQEPYATAVRVIRRNLLERMVTVIPQGVGLRDGRSVAFYDPSHSDVTRASLTSSTRRPPADPVASQAQEVELVSLASVLDMASTHYPGRPLVLKMDCEGCELEAFEADEIREPLKAVESILLEMHEDDCRERDAQRCKLEECGFSVVLTHEKGETSLLLAIRQGASRSNKVGQTG